MHPKFVVYGPSGSGSTLLVELLKGRPDVHCDGELLNEDGGCISSKLALGIVRRYPMPYFAYRRWLAGDKGYRFKLLFYHPAFGRFVLRRLSRSGWKIVQVRRRDVTSQAFSSLIAGKTGRYHRWEGSQDPSYRVCVGTDELDAELARRAQWNRREIEMIDGIDHLDLWYEDDLLVEAAWPWTMAKVARYLGLTPVDIVKPTLKRTDDRPLHAVVENYEELRRHLGRDL